MKTMIALILTLVLTASLLVGCGCTNRNIDNTSAPTVLPTNEEMWSTTEPTTRATTEPTNRPTTPDSTMNTTRETIDNGNGGIDDTLNTMDTTATEGTLENRARRMIPGTR